MKVKNIRHCGIVVRDMDKSVRFYCGLLGLKIVKDYTDSGKYIDTVLGMQNVDLRMVKCVTEDGGMIELLEYLMPKKKEGSDAPEIRLDNIGGTHVAFTVGNVDGEYARLAGEGVKFVSKPVISPDGYAKVAFCQDPDGFYIELVQVL
jgi:catechol 2,3-dioxygenase-like lactoylglutathione lyase family enzyme